MKRMDKNIITLAWEQAEHKGDGLQGITGRVVVGILHRIHLGSCRFRLGFT